MYYFCENPRRKLLERFLVKKPRPVFYSFCKSAKNFFVIASLNIASSASFLRVFRLIYLWQRKQRWKQKTYLIALNKNVHHTLKVLSNVNELIFFSK